MLSKYLILIFLMSIKANANPCNFVDFKYQDKQQEHVLNLNICFNGVSYFSESCFYSKCNLIKKVKEKKLTASQFGSPHYRLCHEIGGQPILGQIKSFNPKEKNISLFMCFDNKQEEFVDAQYILTHSSK